LIGIALAGTVLRRRKSARSIPISRCGLVDKPLDNVEGLGPSRARSRAADMATAPRFGFYYALASIPLMGAGVFGPDVFHLSVEAKTVAFYVCLGLASLCVVIGAIKELRAEADAAVVPGHRRRMISIAGMFICGIGFLTFAAIYFWPQRSSNSASSPAAAAVTPSTTHKPWKHELEDLYSSDFNLLSMQREMEVKASDKPDDPTPITIKMKFKIYQDFNSEPILFLYLFLYLTT
jgi:hypothetical protein